MELAKFSQNLGLMMITHYNGYTEELDGVTPYDLLDAIPSPMFGEIEEADEAKADEICHYLIKEFLEGLGVKNPELTWKPE